MYRSHGLSCTQFNLILKTYLEHKQKTKNHIIVGDTNINILNRHIISTEFLTNSSEIGFLPGFTNTTRPSTLTAEKERYIDNIFLSTIGSDAHSSDNWLLSAIFGNKKLLVYLIYLITQTANRQKYVLLQLQKVIQYGTTNKLNKT